VILDKLFIVDKDLLIKFLVYLCNANITRINRIKSLIFLVNDFFGLKSLLQQVHNFEEGCVLFTYLMPELFVRFSESYGFLLKADQMLAEYPIGLHICRVFKRLANLIQKPSDKVLFKLRYFLPHDLGYDKGTLN
jgi:hypothetical protein